MCGLSNRGSFNGDFIEQTSTHAAVVVVVAPFCVAPMRKKLCVYRIYGNHITLDKPDKLDRKFMWCGDDDTAHMQAGIVPGTVFGH